MVFLRLEVPVNGVLTQIMNSCIRESDQHLSGSIYSLQMRDRALWQPHRQLAISLHPIPATIESLEPHTINMRFSAILLMLCVFGTNCLGSYLTSPFDLIGQSLLTLTSQYSHCHPLYAVKAMKTIK